MTLLPQETGNKKDVIFEECFNTDFETFNSTLVNLKTSNEIIFAVFNTSSTELLALSISKNFNQNNWNNLNFEKKIEINETFLFNENFIQNNFKLDFDSTKFPSYNILEVILNEKTVEKNYILYVFRNKNKHILFLKHHNKPLFFNEFEINNLDELLFYIISIVNSEKIENENLKIYLLYNSWDNINDLKEFLLDYFIHVEIPELENFNVNQSFKHYGRQIHLMQLVL